MKSSLRVYAETRTPVPFYATAGGSMIRHGRPGVSAYRAMDSLGTVFSIVDLLAGAMGGLEWHLFRKPPVDGRRRYSSPDSGEQDRVEVTRHAAKILWDKPNPFFRTSTFAEAVQQHYELVGEQCWLVGRTGNVSFPTSLWPVRPDRIEPVPDPRTFLAGYLYHGPDGETVPLGVDQLIRVYRPHPADPLRGIGAVQSVLTDIDSARYSVEWNRQFFRNNAVPGGVIEVPQSLSDTDFKRISRRWREQHQGIYNAHRVAILEMGKWVDTQFNMRDMQFTELRNLSRDVIREAWRIHKHMLGLSDDVNRANAITAEEVFARWEIANTRARRMREALNHELLPMFGVTGDNVEFDFCDPVPENQELENATMTAKAEAYKTLLDAGMRSDMAARIVGYPQIATARQPGSQDAQPPSVDQLPENSGFSERELTELVESFREGIRQ